MLLERCHMSNWWSTSGKFLFMSALIHDTWQHCNNYNSPPTQMSNTPNLSRVVFTSRQIESSCDQNQKWGQGTWSVVLEVRGWQEQRGGGVWRSWPKDFIGSDGGSSSWQELIGLSADQFARDRENISQPWGKTSGLQMKYMSFLKPWGETSVLLM